MTIFKKATLLVVYIVTILGCSNAPKNRAPQEYRGEFTFSDASDLQISGDNQNVGFVISVYERSDADDYVSFIVNMSSSKVLMSITVSEPIAPPDNGISVDKEYTIGEINNDMGMPNQINLKINSDDNQDYISVDGKITLKYKNGNVEGSFDATIRNVRDNESNYESKHISGTFKADETVFNCYTLENTIIDTNGGIIDDNVSDSDMNSPPITYAASLDNPFCIKYL